MHGGQIQTSEIPQDERGTNKTLPMKKKKKKKIQLNEKERKWGYRETVERREIEC